MGIITHLAVLTDAELRKLCAFVDDAISREKAATAVFPEGNCIRVVDIDTIPARINENCHHYI
jgi:hypothetical protein